MIEIKSLCPLLGVFDMPRSVQFYCDVLGFEMASHAPAYATENGFELFHWAWLKRGTVELMLNTAYDEGERPTGPDPAREAAHADTYLYFACRDLDAAYAELQAKSIACSPPKAAPYGMRQLFFRDPDGFCVVLQHPVA